MDYRERWELRDYLFGRILERRILLFHIMLLALLLIFILNFWYLQGLHGEEYASLAEYNRMRRIPLKPTRGVIFDRNEEVIASTRPSLDLMLRREDGRDLLPQLESLAPIVGTPVEELQQRLAAMRGRPLFEALLVKEDVRLEQLARIEARRERFPSVEIRQHARRFYPEEGLVAHAIGYVGEVGEERLSREAEALERGDIVGKSGVERVFDDALRGRRGWKLVSVNNLGRQIGDSRVERTPDHGADLELTLNLRLQRALVEALGEEAGAGIFMDPRSGEILAIASTPVFNPNMFADGISHQEWQQITEDPRRPLHDRAIASFYAPGSTFKFIMAVAALETGTVDPGYRVFCNGSATFYGRPRLCWKRGGHGWVEMRKALAESCNVYFYTLGQKLGIDPISEYGGMFGLGSPTGIAVAGEEAGILPSREWKQRVQREPWYPGDTISVAIGQGLLAVTPIQMARAISAVATGGTMPRPRLHRDETRSPTTVPISSGTLSVVRGALAEAVKSGTARRATTGAFTVAGKTGTAQVYKHSAGVHSDKLPKEERDHSWFVGYAPADQPRIAFAVIVEHGGHGGTAAAPVVREVLKVFFAAEPDRSVPAEQRARFEVEKEESLVRPSAAG
jgi:penicillin-binding protein 2